MLPIERAELGTKITILARGDERGYCHKGTFCKR
tara:strand:+ start:1719 stop:1820 length:102 start_codon:yes stop_codon:yes gene_type:complete